MSERLSWWHGDGGEGAKRNLGLIGVLVVLVVIGAATRWTSTPTRTGCGPTR